MKKMAMAITAISMLATPALAQNLTPVDAPARAFENEQPSAEKVAAARRMIVLQSGGEAMSPELVEVVTRQIREGFMQDPNLAPVEKEFPGLIDHLVARVVPVAVRQTNALMPDLFDRQAQYFAWRMTVQEIAAASEFYARPVYDSIRRKLAQNADFSSVIENALQDPTAESEITDDMLDEIQKSAAMDSMRQLSREELSAILRFSASPAGRKMARLSGGANAIEARWSNETSTEMEREITQTALAAIEEFLEGNPAK